MIPAMLAILWWLTVSLSMLAGYVLCSMLVSGRDRHDLKTANLRSEQWESIAKLEAASKHRAINDLQAARLTIDALESANRKGDAK